MHWRNSKNSYKDMIFYGLTDIQQRQNIRLTSEPQGTPHLGGGIVLLVCALYFPLFSTSLLHPFVIEEKGFICYIFYVSGNKILFLIQ